MKWFVPCLIALLIHPAFALAGTKVFPYSDFGPQAAVHELIGFGWPQWQSTGNENQDVHPGIKVVVFWNEGIQEVKDRFPPNREKEIDYRYLDRDKAIRHLEKFISEFETIDLDASRLKKTLTTLRKTRSTDPGKESSDEETTVQMEKAWEILWNRFRHPGTHLFYDFISSYEKGHTLDHLPMATEVKAQFPNPCGYGTGMEDSMILGGALLSALVDRYSVTGEESIRTEIADVFLGVEKCVMGHFAPGFVARSVCVEDGESIYINSSRDQVTHCAHGLWKYYHSSLSDEDQKERMRKMIRAIADRMVTNVVPETNFDSLRADGENCPLGISRMWKVQAHEAARLPMIYAVAAELTGVARYEKAYLQYAAPAIEQSSHPSPDNPAYALLQMQCSLEVLHFHETDENLRKQLEACMDTVAELASRRVAHVQKVLSGMDTGKKAMLPPHWREVDEWKTQGGYRIPQWGEYRHVWHHVREAGEAQLVTLMTPNDKKFSPETLETLMRETDYAKTSGCGIVYHVAAYWKSRALDAW